MTIRLVSAAAVLACLAAAGTAQAGDIHWSVGVAVPGVVPGVVLGAGNGYPAYNPAPVYMLPPPPPPVYYTLPRPVYYYDYGAPPVYYAPPPPVVYYGPCCRGHWHGHYRVR